MATKASGIKIGEQKASAKQETELEKALRENAELKAQLASKQAETTSGRVYAPAETPLAVAQAIATENPPAMLRQILDLMVKRVPNSPVSETEPYGKAVLVWNKAHTAQMNDVKTGIDRGNYIKVRDLIDQIMGRYSQHKAPKPLSEDQINKVLRPVLDECHKVGFFNWE